MHKKSLQFCAVPIFVAVSLALMIGARQHIVHARDPIHATRLFAGADGLSHIEQVEIKFSPRQGSVQGEQSVPMKSAQSYVVRLQPGYFENWHNANARRYVVPVSGRAEVELSAGGKALIEPGQIWMAEDLTGKGHTFRVVGDQEWIAVFVDFAP